MNATCRRHVQVHNSSQQGAQVMLLGAQTPAATNWVPRHAQRYTNLFLADYEILNHHENNLKPPLASTKSR